MNDTLIIYDADPDGFGSAYAAWKKFGDDADYLEVLHGTSIPDDAFGYHAVIFLDLCPSDEDYGGLKASGSLVTVIDHHPSAKEFVEQHVLNPFPFDTTTAACEQAWRFFHPYEDVPSILLYVGDRDTWTWEMHDSEEINQFIYNTQQDFESWDIANYIIENDYNQAFQEGTALVSYRDKLVNEIVEGVTTITNWNGYHFSMGIPFVVAPVLHSEVGHKLLGMFPYSPFAVTYSDDPKRGVRKYSLRSEDHRADVGEFAKARGGGGHHNAAGFSKPLSIIWKEGYEAIH